MPTRSPALTTRSDQRALAPRSGDAALEDLLDAESGLACWRVVEVVGEHPLELELAWSAGSGSGARAQLTVSRSARVSVFARNLSVRAGNLAPEPNRVSVTVADGQAVTRGVYEVTGDGSGQDQPVAIPPFAERVRLEVSDPAQLATSVLLVQDAQGALRSTVPADRQPPEGVSLGGAGEILVRAPLETAWRVLFTLCL